MCQNEVQIWKVDFLQKFPGKYLEDNFPGIPTYKTNLFHRQTWCNAPNLMQMAQGGCVGSLPPSPCYSGSDFGPLRCHCQTSWLETSYFYRNLKFLRESFDICEDLQILYASKEVYNHCICPARPGSLAVMTFPISVTLIINILFRRRLCHFTYTDSRGRISSWFFIRPNY